MALSSQSLDPSAGNLKTISRAQSMWHDADPDDAEPLDYGTLADLDDDESLIDSVLSGGTQSGYVFQAAASPGDVEAAAWRAGDYQVKRSDKYFETSHEGVIFYTSSAAFELSCDDASEPNPDAAIDFKGWESTQMQPVGR
jgi:hypothetical protein